jgi:hypothetical protein
MECVLLYHETQAFVRMVAIVDLAMEQNKKWCVCGRDAEWR